MVVVTKVDKIDINEGEGAIPLNNFYDDPRVIHFCRKVKKAFYRPVFPMINYQDRVDNVPSIDYVGLKICEMLATFSRNNVTP